MTETANSATLIESELTKAQRAFIDFCKDFGWGKLEVTVKNGEPVKSREIEHDHKHD